MSSFEIPNQSFEQLPSWRSQVIDNIAKQLPLHTSPNYPSFEDRLRLTRAPYDERGLVALPNEGPWVAGQSIPTRYQKIHDILPMVGAPRLHTLDADYRALHPWWRDMLLNPTVGVVTGRGFFRHWGANQVADAALICQGQLLLVQRKDTGQWALPGGFLNKGERSLDAAVRELHEETNIDIAQELIAPEHVYTGPVLDIRTTIHAWQETSLWRFHLDADVPPMPRGSDDAKKAQWFSINELPQDLYGSHPLLVARSLAA